jgi:drug/metabolite transporter (DMT)-like permease
MGIALMVLTSFLFTTMAALIKGLGTEFPPMEVVFWRSLFSLAILMFLVRRQKVPHFGRSHKNILLVGAGGDVLLFLRPAPPAPGPLLLPL